MVLIRIKEAFKEAKKRNFEELYYAVDIHGTIIKPDYDNSGEIVFYPYAKETLQLLSEFPFIILVLYTCSHPEQVEKYQKLFIENKIFFTQVNKNTNIKNTTYGCFTDKPYISVGIDDKFSFKPKEWEKIYYYFKTLKNSIDEIKSIDKKIF